MNPFSTRMTFALTKSRMYEIALRLFGKLTPCTFIICAHHAKDLRKNHPFLCRLKFHSLPSKKLFSRFGMFEEVNGKK